MRVRHRHGLIAGAVVAALLLIGLSATLAAPDLRATARDFNLIQILREIAQANSDTQVVNGQILDALSSVESQAARVAAVDTRLATLEAALAVQQKSLDRLKGITADEARLSRQLQDLAAVAGASAQGMAETARTEAQDMAGLNRVTATLAGRLNEISRTNTEVADKLSHVDGLAARILNDMP